MLEEEWQCNVCGEIFILSGELVCPFCESTDITEYEEPDEYYEES